MWKLVLVAAATVMLLAPASTAWSDAQVLEFDAVLEDTAVVGWPEPGAGGDWVEGGIWHTRGVLVTDTLSGDLVGTAERSISFDMNLTSGASTARCNFTFAVTDPFDETWTGRCQGTLVEGTFAGHGADGTFIHGTYGLAPGGVPAVGPYWLEGTILQPVGRSDA